MRKITKSCKLKIPHKGADFNFVRMTLNMQRKKLPLALSPYYLNCRLKEQNTALINTVNTNNRHMKRKQHEHEAEKMKLLKKIEILEAQQLEMEKQKFEMLKTEYTLRRIIDHVEEKNIRLTYTVNRYDIIMQNLHTELTEKESLIEKALETFKSLDEKQDDSSVCHCCYSLCNKRYLVSCNSKENVHVFCKTCVESQAKHMWEKVCIDGDGKIACFSIDECEGSLNLCPGEYCKKWIANSEFQKVSLPMMREQSFLNEEKLDAKTQNLLRFDGSFLGYKCSNCNFGPLWHDFCSDLYEHHGTQFDNTCPRCHHFHDSTDDMQRWDGNQIASLSKGNASEEDADDTNDLSE